MTPYTRRALLAGNTTSMRVQQPYIVGVIPKDSVGTFPALTLPAELRIETEGGTASATLNTNKTMTTLLAELRAQLGALAEFEDREGCLLVRTLGTGEGSFISIQQGLLGFSDASFVFGFPRYPDPRATIVAAEEAAAPVRPSAELNPAGSKFLARGEDRTSAAYNRALQSLGRNTDALYTWLSRTVAVPVVVEIDKTAWAAYLHHDGSGNLDQIDLSGLGTFYPELAGRRLYVGGLTNDSTLDEIGYEFKVLDSEDKEMSISGTPIRVGAVTRGLRPGSAPTFTDEVSAPSAPLFDTSGAAPDGGNALGVSAVKSAKSITEVLFNSSVLCAGATFVTDGVRAGDTATITGSTVDIPFNHAGVYVVETVVSEEELVLRASDPSMVGELNPDTGGVLGTVTITTGGKFSESVFVTLVPALTRFPPSNKIRLVFGVEFGLFELTPDAGLKVAVKSAEEVSAFTQNSIQQHLSLGGIYAGPDGVRGAGFYGKLDTRPFVAVSTQGRVGSSTGTLVRTKTGAILANNILEADPTDTFTTADVGKVVRLSGGTFLTKEPFVVTAFLDGAHVRISPFSSVREGADLAASAAITYSVYSNALFDIPASFSTVTSEGASGYGFSFERRHLDTGTAAPVAGQSFLHIERVKIDKTPTNIAKFVVTFAGTDTVSLPFDPEETSNIFAAAGSDTRDNEPRVGSLCRILNGIHAGVYVVWKTKSVTVSANAMRLRNLDGSTPTFLATGDTIYASFFNVHFGTKVALSTGTSEYGMFVYEDVKESGKGTASAALGFGWRGVGNGIKARLNDNSFAAYDLGDGASGSSIYVESYTPASGPQFASWGADTGARARRSSPGFDSRTKSHAWDLDLEGMSYAGFHSWAGRFVQRGSDPGLVVQRATTEDTDPDPVPVGQVGSAAALWLGSAVGIVGKGSAAHVLGSVYLQRATSGSVDWDAGGVYSESTIAARFMYPLASSNSASEPFWGLESPTTDFERPTALGQPGQVFPGATADAPLTGRLYGVGAVAPSPSVPHVALLANTAFLTGAPERWIGTRVKISSGSVSGSEFVVSAITTTGYAVLTGTDPTLGVGTDELVNFKVYGQRWHEFYGNVADWSAVGTAFDYHTYNLPIYTVGLPTTDSKFYDTLTDLGVATVLNTVTDGAMSTVQWTSTPYGQGVAKPVALVDTATFKTTTYLAYTDEWQTDLNEPRAPFPDANMLSASVNEKNTGTVVQPVQWYLSYDNPGDLQADGFALEHVHKNSPDGMYLGWYAKYGGCLLLTQTTANGAGALVHDLVRIWKRGSRGFPKANYARRVRLWVVPNPTGVATTTPITLQLATADGTVVASHAVDVIGSSSPVEVVYDFTAEDLNERAFDHLDATSIYDKALHSVVQLTCQNKTSGGHDPTYLLVLLWEDTDIARPLRITSSVEVNGSARAQEFRHVSPIQEFETIGPMSVDLLNRQEYAHHRVDEQLTSSPTQSDTIERGSVGLVQLTATDSTEGWWSPVFDTHMFFHKGPHNAAVVGYHPYYDPLWYKYWEREVDPLGVVLPGKTGFLGALNPPHGARLSSFQIALSFAPSYVSNGDGSYMSLWQVWTRLPHALAAKLDKSSLFANWTVRSTWDAVRGVTVKLWRFHTFDFGEVMSPEGVKLPDQYTGPTQGYGEELYSEEILLTESPPAFGANDAGGSDPAGLEVTKVLNANLRVVIADENKRLVDKRHFTYGFTVEFWIGGRLPSGTDSTYQYIDGTNVLGAYLRTQIQTGATKFKADAVRVKQSDTEPVGEMVTYTDVSHPQVVKFRGARLGWSTDRVGNGF